MPEHARVVRGDADDRGEYRADLSDYGATFWTRTDRKRVIPVTDATMRAWLKSGKAVPMSAPVPVTPEPEEETEPEQPWPTDEDDNLGTFEGRDVAEANWLAEVAGWSRLKRLEVLRHYGASPDPAAAKGQLADELLALWRKSHARAPRKRTTSPATPRPRRAAPSLPVAAPSPLTASTGDPWASRGIIVTPGVRFEGQ